MSKPTEAEKKEALGRVEDLIEIATNAVKYANRVARENGIILNLGLIQQEFMNEEGEYVALGDVTEEMADEAEYDGRPSIARVAGWVPSGLNC